MACQEVPQDLLNMAMMDPNFKKGRGNPRKGFGRGDEKLRPGLGADSASSVCTKSFKECSITSNVPCICTQPFYFKRDDLFVFENTHYLLT